MVLQNMNKNQFLLPPSTALLLFFISVCFSPWLKLKPAICVGWWPQFGRDLTNIATCCEGFAMDSPPWGSRVSLGHLGASFRRLLLAFHVATLTFCSWKLLVQLCLLPGPLLNAATWPQATNVAGTSVNCEETLVMDAASDIPAALLAPS